MCGLRTTRSGNSTHPGTEWNCKCDIEETDEPITKDNPQGITRIEDALPGIEGNPAETGEVFTDNASYIRAYSRPRRIREEAERKCEEMVQKATENFAKQSLLTQTTKCNVGSDTYDVIFIPAGVSHCVKDMFGDGSIYWLKNEILPNITKHIRDAEYIGRKISDDHNTAKHTKALKNNSDYFYYYRITLPSGQEYILHMGHYKSDFVNSDRANKMYLYSISKRPPKDIEMP